MRIVAKREVGDRNMFPSHMKPYSMCALQYVYLTVCVPYSMCASSEREIVCLLVVSSQEGELLWMNYRCMDRLTV